MIWGVTERGREREEREKGIKRGSERVTKLVSERGRECVIEDESEKGNDGGNERMSKSVRELQTERK